MMIDSVYICICLWSSVAIKNNTVCRLVRWPARNTTFKRDYKPALNSLLMIGIVGADVGQRT